MTMDPLRYSLLSFHLVNSTMDAVTVAATDYENFTVGHDDNKQECINFRFILNTIIMSIMCLIGFACNSLSLVVLRQDVDSPVASFLLRCIAVTDNCFIVTWLINYSIKDLLKFYEIKSHLVWTIIRVYTYPALYVAQTQMIWLTVIIAFNRLVAVCFPFRNSLLCSARNVHCITAAVTAFSILYNLPRFCERYVSLSSPNSSGDIISTVLEESHVYKVVYIDASYYLFSFILPILLLLICSCCVVTRYRKMQGRKRHINKSSARRENENNITVVMTVVVLVFLMCQAPARFVQIVWSYSFSHCRQFQFYLYHASNTLEVLNSSLNFVVYCLYHRNFRIILTGHLRCFRQVNNSAESVRLYDGSLQASANTSFNGKERDVITGFMTSRNCEAYV